MNKDDNFSEELKKRKNKRIMRHKSNMVARYYELSFCYAYD